jgi:hypothetical protein
MINVLYERSCVVEYLHYELRFTEMNEDKKNDDGPGIV